MKFLQIFFSFLMFLKKTLFYTHIINLNYIYLILKHRYLYAGEIDETFILIVYNSLYRPPPTPNLKKNV